MASSSILLFSLERLSPPGSLNVRDKSTLLHYSLRHRQRGMKIHHSLFSQRLTISTMYGTSLVSGSLSLKTLEGVHTGAKNGDRSPRLSIVCYSRGRGGSGHERAKLENVTKQMRSLLESESLLASKAANSLVDSMTPEGRSALISALFPGKQHTDLVLGF